MIHPSTTLRMTKTDVMLRNEASHEKCALYVVSSFTPFSPDSYRETFRFLS